MFLKKINEQEKQKGATKERLSVWQKYFINGELPSICRNGRGTELQYDRWKNQQSATEKGESRSTKEEEICPFAFV